MHKKKCIIIIVGICISYRYIGIENIIENDLLNLSFQKINTNRFLVVFGINTFTVTLNH